jgi:hypothetical protein
MKSITKIDIYALLGEISCILAIFTSLFIIKIPLTLPVIFLILGGLFTFLLGKEVDKY